MRHSFNVAIIVLVFVVLLAMVVALRKPTQLAQEASFEARVTYGVPTALPARRDLGR